MPQNGYGADAAQYGVPVGSYAFVYHKGNGEVEYRIGNRLRAEMPQVQNVAPNGTLGIAIIGVSPVVAGLDITTAVSGSLNGGPRVPFTDHAPTENKRFHTFTGLAPGTYPYEIRVDDDQPSLTGTFFVTNPVDVKVSPTRESLTGTPGTVYFEVTPKSPTTELTAPVYGTVTNLEGRTLFTNRNLNSGVTKANAWVHEILNVPVGVYNYLIEVEDGQSIQRGNFTIAKEQNTAYDCQLTYEGMSQVATDRGKATGKLLVKLSGGTGDGLFILTQDGAEVLRQTLDTTPASGQTIAEVTLSDLPAGLYDLTVSLVDHPDCKVPAAPKAGETPKVIRLEVLPPDLEIGDQLVFLPWVQPQLTSVASGTRVQLAATLSIDPAVAATSSTPAIPATRNTKPETVATTTARIYGPGEVMGLHQRAILGTTPAPDATGFSPLQLAAIEFQDEDLPWRYSTRKRAAFSSDFNGPGALKNKPEAPLPWLFLLVLKGTEFTTLPLTGPLPRIAVSPGAPLPSGAAPAGWVAQPELWAHVQVMAPLGTPGDATTQPTPPSATELDNFLNKTLPASPDLAYSRLLSPRRLAADTAYTAFVLPALEVGRLAGLGLSTANIDETTPAIPDGPRSAALEFPVYFQWQFSTGSEEDFESLVAQLGSAQASTTAATAPRLAVPTPAGTYPLPMPALLVDAAAPVPTDAATNAALLPPAGYLYTQLTPGLSLASAAGSRPVVTPPLYGRAYLDQLTLTAPTSAAPIAGSWQHRVNLDARYRTLAALGAQVVRTNQEEYVRRAWDQVQDILLANEKLRGAQYGLRTTTGLRDQHLPLATIITTTTTTSAMGGGNLATSFTSPDASFASAQASTSDGPTSAGFVPESVGSPRVTTSTSTATSVGMADYGLHLTGLALSRVRVTDPTTQAPLTAREAIRRSSTPLAAFSPTFRRLTKPFGNYVVGQAGRPLRPTQPEGPAPASPTLREAGTSLRQRDVLLTSLAQGRLAATPPLAEQARTLQFADDRVDKLLLAFNKEVDTSKISISQLTGNADALARLQAAFGGFVVQPTATTGTAERRVGFRKPQYKRPALALPTLLTGLVTGTAPGPIFTKKIGQAAPTVSLPPTKPVVPGDFEAVDFNANDFYVGDDVEEPAYTIPADWLGTDFSPADFRTVAGVVYDSPPAPVLDAPMSDAPAPVVNALLASEVRASPPPTNLDGITAGSPASIMGESPASSSTTSQRSTATSTAAPATDGTLPALKQAKVFPVFKDPMGEPLRLLHPDLFVPGLGDFPASGVAVLDVNQAFIEAYMVGLNHALGSELSWRGFPVDLRGTFFQQFWDVSEHLNTTLPADATATANQEAALVDIKPLDQWGRQPLGANAPAPAANAPVLLRLAVRSELLRRYPNLVLALQLTSVVAPAQPAAPAPAVLPDPTAPATLLHPRQRLAVGQDMAIVTFAVPQVADVAAAKATYSLLLMERPGQPKFGFDELVTLPDPVPDPVPLTTVNPLSWNDLSVPYLRDALGIKTDDNLAFYPIAPPAGATSLQPRATAEPAGVAYLTDGARVAYALFQEPVLASLPLADIFG
ncbi:hypothetical protein [Hymenobacter arcticus]